MVAMLHVNKDGMATPDVVERMAFHRWGLKAFRVFWCLNHANRYAASVGQVQCLRNAIIGAIGPTAAELGGRNPVFDKNQNSWPRVRPNLRVGQVARSIPMNGWVHTGRRVL